MKEIEEKKSGSGGDPGSAGRPEELRPAAYLRAVKAKLRTGGAKEAYSILQAAVVQFPEEAVLLSYYGYLQAVADQKFRSGVETCKEALALYKKKQALEDESHYPVFYLNLGRAYLAAGKKSEALESFRTGLRYDAGNIDIKKELRGMGVRHKPVVPFLGRSNPINQLLGWILWRRKQEPGQTKK